MLSQIHTGIKVHSHAQRSKCIFGSNGMICKKEILEISVSSTLYMCYIFQTIYQSSSLYNYVCILQVWHWSPLKQGNDWNLVPRIIMFLNHTKWTLSVDSDYNESLVQIESPMSGLFSTYVQWHFWKKLLYLVCLHQT